MSNHITLTEHSLMLTSYITVVHNQNQESNNGTILVTQLQTLGEFQQFCRNDVFLL